MKFRIGWLSVAAVLVLAQAALAKPEFPSQLDQNCASQMRSPADPAAQARSAATLGDCGLCHAFDLGAGSGPAGGNVTSVGNSWNSNLDPFCTLAPMNQPPTLDPIGNQTVAIDQLLQVMLTASDADGDALGFAADPMPAGATLAGLQAGAAVFEWIPAANQAGLHSISFSVSDGALSDSETVVVTAGDVNAPPVLESIGDQQVALGEVLTLALSATDPENTALQFSVEGLPLEASFTDGMDGTAELVWVPMAPAGHDVTVTVTDSGDPPAAASETFRLTAIDPAVALRIDRARWTGRKLKIRGAGAVLREPVTIVDDESGAELGTRRARRNGAFRLGIRAFLVPCAVRAVTAEGSSPAFAVEGAPDDCGERILTRLREAEWDCEDFELEIRGDRAPAEAAVRFYDSQQVDVLLAETTSDRRGRFRLEQTLAAGPGALEVGVQAGPVELRVGPFPVERDDCDEDDDDSDDGDDETDDDDSDDADDETDDDDSDDADDETDDDDSDDADDDDGDDTDDDDSDDADDDDGDDTDDDDSDDADEDDGDDADDDDSDDADGDDADDDDSDDGDDDEDDEK